MPVQTPNQSYRTIRRAGRVVIPNANKNNLPKAGENGTGSQFPGFPEIVPTKKGNAFGRNGYEKRVAASPVISVPFGERSNAGVATSPTNRTQTDGVHPNAHHYNIATQHKKPATVPGAAAVGFHPISPDNKPLLMPHERTGIGANHGKNLRRRQAFRTVSGGAQTAVVESNTPFHPKFVPREPKPPARPAIQARNYPLAARPSFQSRNNLWFDANNSFLGGKINANTGKKGVGRWQTVKRGAAG